MKNRNDLTTAQILEIMGSRPYVLAQFYKFGDNYMFTMMCSKHLLNHLYEYEYINCLSTQNGVKFKVWYECPVEDLLKHIREKNYVYGSTNEATKMIIVLPKRDVREWQKNKKTQ